MNRRDRRRLESLGESPETNNSSKAVLYRELKTVFEIEQYITKYPWNTVRYILKFRTSNHKLAVEKGRYNNIERNQRYCEAM